MKKKCKIPIHRDIMKNTRETETENRIEIENRLDGEDVM